MWLDARHLGKEFWEHRFPTILATGRAHGVDPTRDLIPVAPACHYASGGVRTDLWGRSTLKGLYATGEVACSGVHGANRLASNSLLEGLVFSRRIAQVLPTELGEPPAPSTDDRPTAAVDPAVRPELQRVMTDRVGVLRSADGLEVAAKELEQLGARRVPTGAAAGPAAWEATNLVTVSTALARAARFREETRGSHWREDFPARDDGRFAGHVDVSLRGSELQLSFDPSSASDEYIGTEVPA
jgi:L-aspartate oxidase